MVGRAGQSLAALQNPFLHSPVAGRLGHSQMEVPSHHKAPKLQVSPCQNYLLPFSLLCLSSAISGNNAYPLLLSFRSCYEPCCLAICDCCCFSFGLVTFPSAFWATPFWSSQQSQLTQAFMKNFHAGCFVRIACLVIAVTCLGQGLFCVKKTISVG